MVSAFRNFPLMLSHFCHIMIIYHKQEITEKENQKSGLEWRITGSVYKELHNTEGGGGRGADQGILKG